VLISSAFCLRTDFYSDYYALAVQAVDAELYPDFTGTDEGGDIGFAKE
jgi:hypothetical protein